MGKGGKKKKITGAPATAAAATVVEAGDSPSSAAASSSPSSSQKTSISEKRIKRHLNYCKRESSIKAKKITNEFLMAFIRIALEEKEKNNIQSLDRDFLELLLENLSIKENLSKLHDTFSSEKIAHSLDVIYSRTRSEIESLIVAEVRKLKPAVRKVAGAADAAAEPPAATTAAAAGAAGAAAAATATTTAASATAASGAPTAATVTASLESSEELKVGKAALVSSEPSEAEKAVAAVEEDVTQKTAKAATKLQAFIRGRNARKAVQKKKEAVDASKGSPSSPPTAAAEPTAEAVVVEASSSLSSAPTLADSKAPAPASAGSPSSDRSSASTDSAATAAASVPPRAAAAAASGAPAATATAKPETDAATAAATPTAAAESAAAAAATAAAGADATAATADTAEDTTTPAASLLHDSSSDAKPDETTPSTSVVKTASHSLMASISQVRLRMSRSASTATTPDDAAAIKASTIGKITSEKLSADQATAAYDLLTSASLSRSLSSSMGSSDGDKKKLGAKYLPEFFDQSTIFGRDNIELAREIFRGSTDKTKEEELKKRYKKFVKSKLYLEHAKGIPDLYQQALAAAISKDPSVGKNPALAYTYAKAAQPDFSIEDFVRVRTGETKLEIEKIKDIKRTALDETFASSSIKGKTDKFSKDGSQESVFEIGSGGTTFKLKETKSGGKVRYNFHELDTLGEKKAKISFMMKVPLVDKKGAEVPGCYELIVVKNGKKLDPERFVAKGVDAKSLHSQIEEEVRSAPKAMIVALPAGETVASSVADASTASRASSTLSPSPSPTTALGAVAPGTAR